MPGVVCVCPTGKPRSAPKHTSMAPFSARRTASALMQVLRPSAPIPQFTPLPTHPPHPIALSSHPLPPPPPHTPTHPVTYLHLHPQSGTAMKQSQFKIVPEPGEQLIRGHYRLNRRLLASCSLSRHFHFFFLSPFFLGGGGGREGPTVLVCQLEVNEKDVVTCEWSRTKLLCVKMTAYVKVSFCPSKVD